MVSNPVVLSVSEPDSSSSEEALIDKYFDILDTKTMVLPISVSISNFLNNVGSCIPVLKEDQASFTPYAIETVFPFLEFVSWCAE
jgi:hypothetical protein